MTSLQVDHNIPFARHQGSLLSRIRRAIAACCGEGSEFFVVRRQNLRPWNLRCVAKGARVDDHGAVTTEWKSSQSLGDVLMTLSGNTATHDHRIDPSRSDDHLGPGG